MKVKELTLLAAILALTLVSGLGVAFFAPLLIVLVPFMALLVIPASFFLTEMDINRFLAIQKNESTSFDPVRARVLVVEDDFDTAALVSTALKNIGCDVVTASSVSQASKQLAIGEFDTVILDWYLENGRVGQEVLDEFEQVVANTRLLNTQFENKSFQLVTFSSARKEEMNLNAGLHFNYGGHWQKPMAYAEIKARSQSLVAV
ncbi:MAG: hypothetical protein KDD25_06690 [Bdellovibrionales bacterium]|nr:hypothetical protein [Bdellovibrionales bacterium]